MKEQKNRVSFFHSIKIKILLLVFGTVLASVVICIATAVPLARSSITNLTESYMEDMVYIAGESLQRSVSTQGTDAVMTAVSGWCKSQRYGQQLCVSGIQ